MAAAIATKTMAKTGLQAIQTEVIYLIKDPKHENRKPYEIRYNAGGIIPNTNMATESRPVIIHDFRLLQSSQSFKDYGFSLAKLDCALTAAEFHDEKRVEEVYYPTIEKLLWHQFPDAVEIKILEHDVRKRHAQGPAFTEEFIEFAQPATLVHIGVPLN